MNPVVYQHSPLNPLRTAQEEVWQHKRYKETGQIETAGQPVAQSRSTHYTLIMPIYRGTFRGILNFVIFNLLNNINLS
jgi:hypothetical protein